MEQTGSMPGGAGPRNRCPKILGGTEVGLPFNGFWTV